MRIRKDLEKVPGFEVANHRIDSWWWLVAAVVAIVALLAGLEPDPYWRIIRFVSDGLLVSIGVT
ncbi:MAG: amino acid ABC transporter permease, partial [Anaerolineaceae bacterium]|nr:amino acid ABC transporter permease [Anaerolineaceae bacterium]